MKVETEPRFPLKLWTLRAVIDCANTNVLAIFLVVNTQHLSFIFVRFESCSDTLRHCRPCANTYSLPAKHVRVDAIAYVEADRLDVTAVLAEEA